MQKITLPLQKINDFISASKYISTDNIGVIPIYQYIKIQIEFEVCTITKRNNNSFCVFSFDIPNQDDCEFVILEERLITFCNNAQEKEFTISLDDKSSIIKIEDSAKYYKQKFNNGAVLMSDFSPVPETDGLSKQSISSDVLNCLSSAKIYSGKDETVGHFSYVYLKDESIFSTNGHVIYVKTVKSGSILPQIALTKTECDLLPELKSVEFCESDNYNIYIQKDKKVIYGFRKPENANGFDYKRFISTLKKENYSQVLVNDIVNFCVSTISFANDRVKEKKDEFPIALFKAEKNGESGVKMIYENLELEKENKIEVNNQLFGNGFEFYFNPVLWLPIIKDLKYDYICISDENTSLVSIFNKSDSSYIGIISKFNITKNG